MIEIIKKLIEEAKQPNVVNSCVCITREQIHNIQYSEITKLLRDNNCKLDFINEDVMSPKIVITHMDYMN